MLPRWHVILGALFTLLIWYFAPGINWEYLALIFLASVFIDLDHYINAALKNKSLHIGKAFEYHKIEQRKAESEKKRGIKRKGDFHLFHTIEFHILMAVMGLFMIPFSYIFIGMVYHSLLDLFYLVNTGYLHRREYFFFNWLGRKF